MNVLAPMQASQFVLAFREWAFDADRSLADNVRALAWGRDTWSDSLHCPLLVRRVERVAPKTYYAQCGLQDRSKRFHRAEVIAAFDTAEEAQTLGAQLLDIGLSADAEIAEQVYAFDARISPPIYAEADRKIRELTPHLFGPNPDPAARASNEGAVV